VDFSLGQDFQAAFGRDLGIDDFIFHGSMFPYLNVIFACAVLSGLTCASAWLASYSAHFAGGCRMLHCAIGGR
jgi:hypothetical protein